MTNITTDDLHSSQYAIIFDLDFFKNQLFPYVFTAFRKYQTHERSHEEVWMHMLVVELAKQIERKTPKGAHSINDFVHLNAKFGSKREKFVFVKIGTPFDMGAFYEKDGEKHSACFEVVSDCLGGITKNVLFNVIAKDAADNPSLRVPVFFASSEDGKNFMVSIYPDYQKYIPLPFEGDVAAAVASPQRDNSVLTGKPPSSDLKR